MIKIKINLENHNYFIFINYCIFEDIAKFHKKNYPGCKAIIITDNNVKRFY